MALFVFALFFALIALALITLGRRAHDSEDQLAGYGFGCLSGGIAGILLFFSSFTTISANHVGVITAFGAYKGVVPSGARFLAPWDDVEEFGTRIQPLEITNVPIRFEGNSGGDADMLIEWRIEGTDEKAVHRLWQDYRTFAAVESRLVHANSVLAVNVVLARYTPADGISGANRLQINADTLAKAQERLRGTGVVVERVTIRKIDPDRGSQNRIDRQVQAKADLDRLATEKLIADQEAAIAKTRSTTQTTGTLQQNCLDITADWQVAVRGPLPAFWDCGFGSRPAPVVPVK